MATAARPAGKHTKPASRQEAMRALADSMPACTHCQPHPELGIPDGCSSPSGKIAVLRLQAEYVMRAMLAGP
ncbi:DUF6233 domain-containing protein [Streptomyces sp. KR55]|uniref:DUF6233 domain-containing protein n=1 Tax=Streptomyces sp. KR55 TaxID=3457425 RepID=UPI003FD27DE2